LVESSELGNVPVDIRRRKIMNTYQQLREIPEGQYTKTIYGLIHEGKYNEVVRLLSVELQTFPRSRAALSLLAYSYYMMQDFANATVMYEQLLKVHPSSEEYKLYLAQSLFKDGKYEQALVAAGHVDDPFYSQRVIMLKAAIMYEQDELGRCKTMIDKCTDDDPEIVASYGCILFKDGKYREACERFTEAINLLGWQADLAYNVALCHFKMKQYGPALKWIAEIIEKGVREHPELSVGSNSDGVEVRSVGNSSVLRETALVEAFNLKAAVEYVMDNLQLAKQALSDMPPRKLNELDPVTLHNVALINFNENPQDSFRKMNFLLRNPPFPEPTFGNILLLYCQMKQYDLAADVLAENSNLTFTSLSTDLYNYIDATNLVETSPEEAYRKFDDLAGEHIKKLRQLTNNINQGRFKKDTAAIKKALMEYDEALEKYIPVLMAQARIYWDREHYEMVETIFKQSAEFCSEHDAWKLNFSHVYFMQENKYREAIKFYEQFVQQHIDNILDVTAIVLANLCVSYIMTSQNEDAEELMRKIEREEEKMVYGNENKKCFHLCIVNLVIGTLYCAKGNYEFGISRIIKSLEPYEQKLGPDTWYYAKRCFLALAEMLAKHMVVLKDNTYKDILKSLDQAEKYGKNIVTIIRQTAAEEVDETRNNVAWEARQLKTLYLRLIGH